MIVGVASAIVTMGGQMGMLRACSILRFFCGHRRHNRSSHRPSSYGVLSSCRWAAASGPITSSMSATPAAA